VVGLVIVIAGSALTGSLFDLAPFVANGFWLVMIALPLIYLSRLSQLYIRLNPAQQAEFRQQRPLITVMTWLSAFACCLVAFMMPVVMVPLVTGQGVTLETSAEWYNQVFSALIGLRVIVIALGTLGAFWIITRSITNNG
jgi:hypothetical protein